MSLRTSAHTGVAIRVPAGKANKLAILWANPQHLSYSPKVFPFAMSCRRECGLPRRFAPRNDMQKLAACAHGKDMMPGKFVTPHEFALSTAVLLCPAAGDADCPVAPLLAMTMGGRPCTRRHAPAFRTPCAPNGLAPAHTSFLLHVIANQCAHWCGNPFPRRETWQVGNTLGEFVVATYSP